MAALNSLQSNAATIARARKTRDKHANKNLVDTIKYLERVGVTLDDLDKLSVIHVAGTKGKGSVCAFTESILKRYGGGQLFNFTYFDCKVFAFNK